MQPNARVRRKDWRNALKGVPRGRRHTHLVETQAPQPGSSWSRRHCQALPLSAYQNDATRYGSPSDMDWSA